MNTSPNTKRGCLRIGCLGLIATLVLLLAALFMFFRQSHSVPDRFVLKVPLGGAIDEIRNDNATLPFLSQRGPLSLQELLFTLDHAASDERVREVVLDIDGLQTTPAKLGELRQAVEHVRKGGKKVTAFLHSAEDSDYLLATACNSIILERGGFLLLDGLKAETLYFATPLGRIGVKVQAAQWKKYKSGIEPFVRTGASKESLEETGALLDEVYSDYITSVAKRRGISREFFEDVINKVALVSASKARTLGLVDNVASSWELHRELTRKITGKEPSSQNDAYVGADDYRSAIAWPTKPGSRDRIAVITISGPIVRSAGESALGMGEGTDEKSLQNSLDSALEDRAVKALVLRIDSPGGDALASANMLQMLDSAAVKKPLVVSMSGVAASGGYMVALAGKSIYAQPLTITGSIGVYALKPELSGLAAKVGLGRDAVTRGRFADSNSLFKPLEGEAYNKFIDASGEIYQDFIEKVAASRKMKVTAVDAVAGGRVWTGSRAMKAGLVDHAGGLFDAIHAAGLLAKLDMSKNPQIMLYPEQKSWFENLMQGRSASLGESMMVAIKKQLIHELVPAQHYSSLEAYAAMLKSSGQMQILTLMPSEIVIK